MMAADATGFMPILFEFLGAASNWAVPLLVMGIPIYGAIRGVKVYEAFIDGAKEGFDVAIRIMPFLVGILLAIGLFRDLEAMQLLTWLVKPATDRIGMPAELLPLALIRPLSGGGATGIMASLFEEYGPDSYIGQMASVMNGSTETTLYVLAVYFGSISVRKTRHALLTGLTADAVGLLGSVWLCSMFFSNLK